MHISLKFIKTNRNRNPQTKHKRRARKMRKRTPTEKVRIEQQCRVMLVRSDRYSIRQKEERVDQTGKGGDLYAAELDVADRTNLRMV
mmetsp:Transcript_73304/g.116846  ORF Transcript_73304/g.116846 Transcript_73304/m.116846 type:complete len:87 (-) Transcript_73304:163-423(-)